MKIGLAFILNYYFMLLHPHFYQFIVPSVEYTNISIIIDYI
ncbi:Putative uncharacterized protein [Moritella viscosa]|uniref:Uncharacterized protein n=1 Tax=Moritella viscosa TaxID=80854 RepID=A0A1L0C022_9GAMM|nr:Putative uncharacterized protein [Moritella viscosa]SGZ06269.1 Putative uncharacterized protein [Moritella viscosa]SGZ19088.1 Putative uncharacterized protein [Moritella viscosa]SHO13512.1 Putative uncharacterized protein [Moritella viscosa]SHO13513.1 Putative uncharacterized protein [Moritella viscosa]